jgi:hypothetical protein
VHDNLIKYREERHLTLRKNKVDEIVMSKRLNSLLNDTRLEIKLQNLQIPDIFVTNYERSHDKLEVLGKLLVDSDIDIKKFALLKFRNITQMDNLESSVINTIVEKLYKLAIQLLVDQNSDNYIRFEASWSIINLLFDYGNIFAREFQDPYLLKSIDLLLSDVNLDLLIAKHLIWILGNLTLESAMFEVLVTNVDFAKHFYNWTLNLNYVTETYDGIIIWACNNYISGYIDHYRTIYQDNNNFNQFLQGFIDNMEGALMNCFQITQKLILIKNKLAIKECLALLKTLSLNNIFHNLIHKANMTPTLIVFLEEIDTYNNLQESIRIISNLLSGSNEHVDVILQYPVINRLIATLTGCVNSIKLDNELEYSKRLAHEIIFALSNIAGSKDKYIDLLINDEELKKGINFIFYSICDLRINKDILYLLLNYFQIGNLYHKSEFMKRNMHHFFTYYILQKDFENKNPGYNEVIEVSLIGIYCFLKYGAQTTKMNYIQTEFENADLPDTIDYLTHSRVPRIYEIALKIMRKYWDFDEALYHDKNDINF